MYSPVHQREFRERTLELTVWDQARVREEESQFLGQVRTLNFLDHLEMLEVFSELAAPAAPEGSYSYSSIGSGT